MQTVPNSDPTPYLTQKTSMSAHSYARYTLQTRIAVEEPHLAQPARSYTAEQERYESVLCLS